MTWHVAARGLQIPRTASASYHTAQNSHPFQHKKNKNKKIKINETEREKEENYALSGKKFLLRENNGKEEIPRFPFLAQREK